MYKKIDMSKYKKWVLILRVIAFIVPASSAIFFNYLGDKSELLCDWLDAKLPDPNK